MPKFLDLEQGSREWLDMRKRCITATDISCIMGVNPYKTAYELWKEKMGISPPQEENDAMRRGKELEPQVLSRVEGNFEPRVAVSTQNEAFMASLDGWNRRASECPSPIGNLIEIKCGKNAFDQCSKGVIPIYYQYQMQWQMYITDQQDCLYICSDGNQDIKLTLYRDQELIEKMILSATEFLEFLDSLTPPPMCERDYIDRSGDESLESMMQNYTYMTFQMKALEKNIELQKARILTYCDQKNTICNSGRITRVVTKGRIKYDLIPELSGMDLDKYRGEETISYRISSSE